MSSLWQLGSPEERMNTAKKILRDFYDQARFTPDLLCLNCIYMDWSGAKQRCSATRRKGCLFFVNDMLNWLVTESKSRRMPKRRPASQALPRQAASDSV